MNDDLPEGRCDWCKTRKAKRWVGNSEYATCDHDFCIMTAEEEVETMKHDERNRYNPHK